MTHHLLLDVCQLCLCAVQLRQHLVRGRLAALLLRHAQLVLQLRHLLLQAVDELVLGLPVDGGRVLDGTRHLGKAQRLLGLCSSREAAATNPLC